MADNAIVDKILGSLTKSQVEELLKGLNEKVKTEEARKKIEEEKARDAKMKENKLQELEKLKGERDKLNTEMDGLDEEMREIEAEKDDLFKEWEKKERKIRKLEKELGIDRSVSTQPKGPEISSGSNNKENVTGRNTQSNSRPSTPIKKKEETGKEKIPSNAFIERFGRGSRCGRCHLYDRIDNVKRHVQGRSCEKWSEEKIVKKRMERAGKASGKVDETGHPPLKKPKLSMEELVGEPLSKKMKDEDDLNEPKYESPYARRLRERDERIQRKAIEERTRLAQQQVGPRRKWQLEREARWNKKREMEGSSKKSGSSPSESESEKETVVFVDENKLVESGQRLTKSEIAEELEKLKNVAEKNKNEEVEIMVVDEVNKNEKEEGQNLNEVKIEKDEEGDEKTEEKAKNEEEKDGQNKEIIGSLDNTMEAVLIIDESINKNEDKGSEEEKNEDKENMKGDGMAEKEEKKDEWMAYMMEREDEF